jgi:large conductance mechanosensitive channel
MKGFREFLLRGNVIDLAVAVVIGTAFTALVTAVVTSIFQPIIGAIFNAKSLDNALIAHITLTAGTADIKFGAVIGAIINFVIIAAVVYFAFVLPINALMKRAFQKPAEPVSADPAPPTELDLLAQIRDLLEGQQQVGDKRILNQD